ncbi:MAG TPA: zf-HC2 domain-containing protein [Anaeromyxobacter sp.]
MSPACTDFEVLLSLRAAGALEPAEAARTEAHLAGCAACRAEAAADEAVLRLATLPPPSAAERRAVAALAADALATLRRREARAASWKRATVGFAAAAALALVVVAPAVLGRKGPVLPPAPAPVTTAATAQVDAWQAPDLDTLWTEADVLDVAGAAYASDATDTSYLAIDLDD